MSNTTAGGFGTRGQVTTERVGGWDEIKIALRNTLILAALQFASIALLGLATLVAGPWSLVVLIPASLSFILRWFDVIQLSKLQFVGIALLVVILLFVVPEAALIWWPWIWQISKASAWGLLLPGASLRFSSALAMLRITLVIGVCRAWREAWYLTQRLRQEIILPTASSITFKQPEIATLHIRNVDNPFSPPEPEPQPATQQHRTTVVHAIPAPDRQTQQIAHGVLVSGNGTNGLHEQIAHWPTEFFHGRTDAEKLHSQVAMARFVLDNPRRNYSRNRCRRYFESNPQARNFFDWMRDQHYAHYINRTTQALTRTGLFLLSRIVDDADDE